MALVACADTATEPLYTGPVRMTVSAAAGDVVACGQVIPETVTVTNDRGKPVPIYLVKFNVLAGGGSVVAGASLTNSRGVAQDVWPIGNTANLANTLAIRAVDNNAGVATCGRTPPGRP